MSTAAVRFPEINPYSTFFSVTMNANDIARVGGHLAQSQTPLQLYDIVYYLFVCKGTAIFLFNTFYDNY
jgi:hypothetical protein